MTDKAGKELGEFDYFTKVNEVVTIYEFKSSASGVTKALNKPELIDNLKEIQEIYGGIKVNYVIMSPADAYTLNPEARAIADEGIRKLKAAGFDSQLITNTIGSDLIYYNPTYGTFGDQTVKEISDRLAP